MCLVPKWEPGACCHAQSVTKNGASLNVLLYSDNECQERFYPAALVPLFTVIVPIFGWETGVPFCGWKWPWISMEFLCNRPHAFARW